MTLVNQFLQNGHLPYLLDLAHRRMQHDLGVLVEATSFPELRGSHFRLLGMIPDDGARPSAIAEVAQITRPALGEMVQHLQEHGYVDVTPDASDGRAVIVRLSARGRRASAAADKAITQLRRRWARDIGAARLESLIDALTALAGEVDP